MNFCLPFKTHKKAPVTVKPSYSSLHYPAKSAQALRRINTSTCDTRSDPSFATCLSATSEVVALVGMKFERSSTRATSPFASNRRDSIKGIFQNPRIMLVRGSKQNRKPY